MTHEGFARGAGVATSAAVPGTVIEPRESVALGRAPSIAGVQMHALPTLNPCDEPRPNRCRDQAGQALHRGVRIEDAPRVVARVKTGTTAPTQPIDRFPEVAEQVAHETRELASAVPNEQVEPIMQHHRTVQRKPRVTREAPPQPHPEQRRQLAVRLQQRL